MGNGYVVPAVDGLDALRLQIRTILERLNELEALDGTQIYNTVQDLRKMIEGLLEQTEVNVSGSGTFGGSVTTGGNFNAAAGTLVSPYARANSVVSSYVAAYLDASGNLLSTPSSARRKRDVATVHWTAEQRARLRTVLYRLRSDYILRDMRGEDAAATTPYMPGVIGEELLAAGFDEFVVLDAKGRVFTVHYELLGLIALDAVQQHDADIAQLRAELAELRAQSQTGGLPDADPDRQ